MIVKREANPTEKVRAIIKAQNGILMTSDLSKHGIPRTYLSVLEKKARAEKLERGGFVSPSVREQAQLAVRVSEKELEAARFELHAAEHDLTQARAALARAKSFGGDGYDRGAEWEVRSPVAGRVLKVLKESEEVVAAGTPIMEVGDPRDLEVVLDLLSTEAVRVRPGAEVELDAGGGLRLAGRVRRVEPAAFTKVSALGVEEQRVNVIVDLVSPPEAWQALGDAYRVED